MTEKPAAPKPEDDTYSAEEVAKRMEAALRAMMAMKPKSRTRIAAWEPGRRFVDEQLSGPYKSWVHTHRFTGVDNGTDIDDEVIYSLPLGPLGRVAAPLVRVHIGRIFRYRESAVMRLLTASR